MSAPRTVFRIEDWRGVWRVTRDGKFHGDYRTRAQALSAAEGASPGERKAGREVQVTFDP